MGLTRFGIGVDPKLSFAQVTALNEVDACTNIHELKAVTRNLVTAYFAQRHFMDQMMKGSLTAPIEVNVSTTYEHGGASEMPV